MKKPAWSPSMGLLVLVGSLSVLRIARTARWTATSDQHLRGQESCMARSDGLCWLGCSRCFRRGRPMAIAVRRHIRSNVSTWTGCARTPAGWTFPPVSSARTPANSNSSWCGRCWTRSSRAMHRRLRWKPVPGNWRHWRNRTRPAPTPPGGGCTFSCARRAANCGCRSSRGSRSGTSTPSTVSWPISRRLRPPPSCRIPSTKTASATGRWARNYAC
jgi:hypothetical protein